jgi:DNA-binding Lrp family transcriptional regulator
MRQGMTIRQIADRAGVSHAQAARHIRDLEGLGIVRREHLGRSHRITLTDTMVSDLILRLARLRDEVIVEMRSAAKAIDPQPSAMALFGSFARGDDDAASDIDVLVVVDEVARGDAIDETLGQWCHTVAARTGNAVAEIVVTLEEYRDMSPPLVQSIRNDAIMIVGTSLPEIPRLRVVAEDPDAYDA